MERQLRVRRYDPARSVAVTLRDNRLRVAPERPAYCSVDSDASQYRRCRLLRCNTDSPAPVRQHVASGGYQSRERGGPLPGFSMRKVFKWHQGGPATFSYNI